MSIAKRNIVIDVIKGIGICLMVCGHSGCPATDWIYLFHMSLFFIASGYLWNEKNASSISNLKKYIIRKLYSLWIPFIIINLFFTITYNIFFSWGLYSNISDKNIITTIPLDNISFFKQVVSNFLFSGGTQLAGATWFLRSLFCISVINAIVVYVLKKIELDRFYFVIIIFIIAGACLVNANEIFRELAGKIGLESFFAGYYAFLLGVILRRINIISILNDFKNILLPVTFILLIILNNYGTIQLNIGHIENILFYTVVSILGWLFISSISLTISSMKISKIFIYISQKSLWIIGLHFLGFKIVSYATIYLTQCSKIKLAYYPVITINNWIWIIYLLVGLLFPLVIQLLYSIVKEKIGLIF
ncbi:acyltransferase family protein [Streptococcus equinus]|uniref:acyltransferase family protein n=1 Tax=Streptococcus equinus TaxID=1335 RepID=UPI003EEF7185